MGKTFLNETAKLLQAKRRRQRWTRTVISLSLAVALVTSSLLSHPALTMESSTTCGMAEHTHGTECVERQLTCGQQERPAVAAKEEKVLNCSKEVHEHTDACKDAEGNVICGKEGHTHNDVCYQIVSTPGDEGHTHNDSSCYTNVTICQKPEHTHGTSCYPQTEAPKATEAPVTEAQTSAPQTTETTAATEPQTTAATETQVTETEPQTSETVVETEKQTEKDTEKESEKETEVKWEAQTLTNKGSDYTITVEAPASAKIPENAILKVREIKKDNAPQEYADYEQKAAAKADQQMAKDVLYARYFDLTIEADGKAIQPSAKVTVKVTYNQAVENPTDGEVKIVVFGDQTEILNTKTNTNGQVWSEAKAEVQKLNVLAAAGIGIEETEAQSESETEEVTEESTEEATEAESESETETATEETTEVESESETETATEEATEVESESETETELEAAANILVAENGDYKVTVSYGKEADLPENVKLSLTNYDESYDEYWVAKEAVASAKQEEMEQFQMRAVDISIIDENGMELEPNDKVKVSIQMKNLPEDCDSQNLEIHHIVENHAVAAYSLARTVSAGSVQAVEVANGVYAANGSAATTFETDSFSTFTITWRNSDSWISDQKLTVRCVDTNGTALPNGTAPSSITLENGQSVTLDTLEIEDYVFVSAAVVVRSNGGYSGNSSSKKYEDVLSIKAEYSFPNSWQYTITYGTGTQTKTTQVSNPTLTLTYKKTNVTLSFNTNGGSGNVDSISGIAGTVVTLPDYSGTREGYTFLGWSPASSLTTDDTYHPVYMVNTKYELPESDSVLYAVWDKNNANVPAYFYVRLDGTIPYEPGYYSESGYTAEIKIDNNINKKHWIVDNDVQKPIADNGKGNYIVNDVTNNLYSMPTNEQLAEKLNDKKTSIGFSVKVEDGELVIDEIIDATKAGDKVAGDKLYVIWYVQKLQNITSNDPIGKWHIDGALQVKDKIAVSYDGNSPAGAGTVNQVPYGYQETAGTNIIVGATLSKDGEVLTPELPGYTFLGWTANTRENTGTLYQNGGSYTLNQNTTFYAQWAKGNNILTVTKTDMSGTTLQGAKFKLEEKNDRTGAWQNVVENATTDANGIFTCSNVSSQTVYRMTETHAPNGYETRNAFYFKVTTDANGQFGAYLVDENGVILSDAQKPSWVTVVREKIPSSDGMARLLITIKDKQIKRNVSFVKTDLTGKKVLSGAEFELKNQNGQVLTATSGTDGKFTFGELTYGTYTLTEKKAPDGYQCAASFTFELNDPTGSAATANGTYTTGTGISFSENANAVVNLVRASSGDANMATTTYTYTITVKNKPKADVTIIKTNNPVNGVREQKLGGVTFKLTKGEKAVEIAGVTNTTGEFTISEAQKENGITLTGLDDGVYKLTETVAPAGYIIKTAETSFTVIEGQVQSFDSSVTNAVLSEDKQVIKIKNEAGIALPNTGGSGTLPYTLCGLLLMAAAMMYGFVLRRRKEEGIWG